MRFIWLSLYYRGAVAADGRIESGDMLIRVNNVGFENMSNDDAVRTLRDIVQQPGYDKLRFGWMDGWMD